MPRTYACIMVGHTQLCLPLNLDTMSAMMEQKQHFRRSRRCYFLSTFLPFLHGPGHNCVLFVSSISYTQPPDKKVLSARCHNISRSYCSSKLSLGFLKDGACVPLLMTVPTAAVGSAQLEMKMMMMSVMEKVPFTQVPCPPNTLQLLPLPPTLH